MRLAWLWVVLLVGVLGILLVTRERFVVNSHNQYNVAGGVGLANHTGYDRMLAELGQTAGYGGAAATSSASGNASGTTAAAAASGNTAEPAANTSATTESAAAASGNTTGGSSTTSAGPNSGGGGDRRKQVFGPQFNGIGDGQNVPSTDSSKVYEYPQLLGGGDSNPSRRVDGAGIVAPSKNWLLSQDGSLPSSSSLGSDENSKYLPFSRTPGDMEKIPDPYRVSQSFSATNYSFKTDPVPFLADFSPFQR